MNILESLRMSFAALKSNKLRSTLTITGITIGSASVMMMVGVGQGAQKLAAEQLESLGPNILFVSPKSPNARENATETPQTLVLADAEAIVSQVPTVAAVAPQINLWELVTYHNRNQKTLVLGVTPDFLPVRRYQIAQGRFLNHFDIERQNRVAIIGSDVAKQLFVAQDPIGKQIIIKNSRFQVVGVMKPKGSFLGSNQDETVFIPITTLNNQLRGQTSPYGVSLTYISVSAKDQENIRAAKFQIENLLRLRHQIVKEDDFTVSTQQQILETANQLTMGLIIMLTSIAGISLLVGGIGIMNIMLVSVSERTQEIGLRKAIGATENDILLQFLIEAIIVSTLGGCFGTILGVSGIIAVSSVSPLPMALSPWVITLAVGTSVAIGLFVGVAPAKQAAKLEPIAALRRA